MVLQSCACCMFSSCNTISAAFSSTASPSSSSYFSSSPSACISPLVPTFYWDNCATCSLVNDLSLLVEVEPVVPQFHIGGVQGGVLVSHVGKLPWLPPSVNRAYFSSDASCNLLSLAFMQDMGCSCEQGSSFINEFTVFHARQGSAVLLCSPMEQRSK